MSFNENGKAVISESGLPFLWGSGDQTTAPSGITTIQTPTGVNFGASVAVGSGYIVVGAPEETVEGTALVGAAYVYNVNGVFQRKLTPAYAYPGRFGSSVAIGSGLIAIGAPFSRSLFNSNTHGVALYFDYHGVLWATLDAFSTIPGDSNNDRSGFSVAIEGGYTAVGSPGYSAGANTGAVSVYRFFQQTPDEDTLKNRLTVSAVRFVQPASGTGNEYGYSVAMGAGRLAIGCPGGNYIDIVDYRTGRMIKRIDLPNVGTLQVGNAPRFGHSVAIGCGRLVVGAPNLQLATSLGARGAIFIYDMQGNLVKSDLESNNNYLSYGSSISVGSGRIVASNNTVVRVMNLEGELITTLEDPDGQQRCVAAGEGRIITARTSAAVSPAVTVFDTPQVYTPYDVAKLNSDGQYGSA